MPRPKVIAVAAVCATAAAIAVVQPLSAPWWVNADPDGAYVGSAVNLLEGNHTVYLDHPGFANQEALALLLGTQYLVERIAGRTPDVTTFGDQLLLHLDDARPLYRGFAVASFVLAALLAFFAVGRVVGDWRWGVPAGVLFAAAPAAGPISFMTRPDVIAAAAALAVACLVALALERRSSLHFLGAGVVLGVALTTKLVVVGLLPVLLLAAYWREPERGWVGRTLSWLRARFRRHRVLIPLVGASWIALCVVFNWGRPSPVFTSEQRDLILGIGLVVCGYAAAAITSDRLHIPVARRIFRPFVALVVTAVVTGLAIPAMLVVDDAPAMLLSIWQTATGRGLNDAIEPFGAVSLSSLSSYPLLGTIVVIGCSIAAGLVGAIRGVYWPLVLAIGSVALAVEAAARLNVSYYYLPAYAVAIPGTTWLFARFRRPFGIVATAGLAATLLTAALTHPATSIDRDLALNRSAQRLADRLLQPGEFILTPYWSTWPIDDLRYDGFVAGFTTHAPARPRRFVEGGTRFLDELGPAVAYYVAPRWEALDALAKSRVTAGDWQFRVVGPVISWGGALDMGALRVVGARRD